MNSSPQPYVAYVGPTPFPNGGAGARRMLGVAQSLRLGGVDVVFGSGQSVTNETPAEFEYDDFTVHSLGERSGAERLPALLKHAAYVGMGRKTRHWLGSLKQKPVAVILYAGYAPYLLQLLAWCKKHYVPLIFDAVEWYEPEPRWFSSYGRLSPYQLSAEISMRKLTVRAGNAISISSYLHAHYRGNNCRSVCVPPTLRVLDIEARLDVKRGSNPVTVAYCGNPGWKDLFDNYLEALLRYDPEGKQIQLRVAGVGKTELLQFPALLSRNMKVLPGCVQTEGMVSQQRAMELVRECDFSVLLRNKSRIAQAGFPTKVVESLAMGTPVMANLTSDLGRYLKDGENSLVCEDPSPGALIEQFKRAVEMGSEPLAKMRHAARKTAQSSFDIAVHADALTRFIKAAKV